MVEKKRSKEQLAVDNDNVEDEFLEKEKQEVELPNSIESLNLEPEEKEVIKREIIQMRSSASFSGPLPPPSLLNEYDQIIPNGAERIFAMAENQSKHRQELETTVVKSNSRDSLLGIISAFLISIITVLVGGYCIINGQPVAGTLIGGLGLASIVGTFVHGTRSEQRERIEKSKDE